MRNTIKLLFICSLFMFSFSYAMKKDHKVNKINLSKKMCGKEADLAKCIRFSQKLQKGQTQKGVRAKLSECIAGTLLKTLFWLSGCKVQVTRLPFWNNWN
ncbi:hypothetical protein ACFLYU_00170 [Candidatus Dependentiae bacterium]